MLVNIIKIRLKFLLLIIPFFCIALFLPKEANAAFGAIGFRADSGSIDSGTGWSYEGADKVAVMIYPWWCPTSADSNTAIRQTVLGDANPVYRYWKALKTRTVKSQSDREYIFMLGDGVTSTSFAPDLERGYEWGDAGWLGGGGEATRSRNVYHRGGKTGWASYSAITDVNFGFTVSIFQQLGDGSWDNATGAGTAEFLFNTSCYFQVKVKSGYTMNPDLPAGDYSRYPPERQIIDWWGTCQANPEPPVFCPYDGYDDYNRYAKMDHNAHKDFALSRINSDGSYRVSLDGFGDSGAKMMVTNLPTKANGCYSGTCYRKVFARISGYFDRLRWFGRIVEVRERDTGNVVTYNSSSPLEVNKPYLIDVKLKLDCETPEFRTVSGPDDTKACRHTSNVRDVGPDVEANREAIRLRLADVSLGEARKYWPVDDSLNNQTLSSNTFNFYYNPDIDPDIRKTIFPSCVFTGNCDPVALGLNNIGSLHNDVSYERFRSNPNVDLAFFDPNADDDYKQIPPTGACLNDATRWDYYGNLHCFDANHYNYGDIIVLRNLPFTPTRNGQVFGIVAEHGFNPNIAPYNQDPFLRDHDDKYNTSVFWMPTLSITGGTSSPSCIVRPKGGEAPLRVEGISTGFKNAPKWNWGDNSDSNSTIYYHVYTKSKSNGYSVSATGVEEGTFPCGTVTVTIPGSGSQKEISP